MRKFLNSLGALALAGSFWFTAPAFAAAVPQATVVENTVAGGMDAAGEVSGTITVPAGTTLSIFWGGTYSAANRFELQEEIGSPGSGAFQKVLRLDTNTANSDDSTTYLTGPNKAAYRVFMTVAGTGDVLVKMTNASLTPNDFTDGQDAGTICTIVTTDKAGLVSDGWISFETRVRNNEVGANIEFGAGFVDAVCDGDSGDIPATISAEELTVVGYTDVAVILLDGDGTFATTFTPFAVNAGVEQHDTDTANTAHAYDTGVVPVDDEYDILRVEIDSSGDVFYYINGALVFAEATGVATTATLAPQVWVNSADGGATTNTMVIDYWLFTITKPADAT